MHNQPTTAPIEVEATFEISPSQFGEFIIKLIENLQFQVQNIEIITDSYTEINDSPVTFGKDIERYRRRDSIQHQKKITQLSHQKKWWEMHDGIDVHRESPEVPVTLREFKDIEKNILVSLIKERISLSGFFQDRPIHVDLDILYDYEPRDLPKNTIKIPESHKRYFIEAKRMVFDPAEKMSAQSQLLNFFMEHFMLTGKQAPDMVAMALERKGKKKD